MFEIDPQSGNAAEDTKLVGALRRMAASAQQGAPAELGAGLATAFRTHHRRKRIRRMSFAGLAVCVVAIAGLLVFQTAQKPQTQQTSRIPQPAQNATQTHIESANATAQETERVQTASASAEKSQTEKPQPVHKLSQPKVITSKVEYSREFAALPGYDPEVPAEDMHIVRVQLPTSTLWQMGAPINPAGPERRVLADFVIGQDGTPYGVRLVHTASF